VAPQPVATEQTTPSVPLPRYGAGVEQAVHNESAPPEAAENKPSQPEAGPHTPKEAPLAAAPLPGVALPLTTDYPPASDESRHLAPRSKQASQSATGDGQSLSDGIKSRLPASFSKLDSLTTAGAGLAIVVGLFFVCMWLLRRSSGAKHGGVLPNEAFAVLGRAPLTPQSFAQLLRVGNKLILVAISADGIQPLTEVIDPLEVDRLTGVCASGRGHGPAAEFQQVLAQLAREPARGFLGAEAANGGGRRRA
jgi:flagellar biogenesis protein FliO